MSSSNKNKEIELVLQFYDAKEAQRAIVNLGSNFDSLQTFPRSSKIRVNTNFSTGNSHDDDDDEIISIETFTYSKTDYVYDVSTDSEHFQAGLGK